MGACRGKAAPATPKGFRLEAEEVKELGKAGSREDRPEGGPPEELPGLAKEVRGAGSTASEGRLLLMPLFTRAEYSK